MFGESWVERPSFFCRISSRSYHSSGRKSTGNASRAWTAGAGLTIYGLSPGENPLRPRECRGQGCLAALRKSSRARQKKIAPPRQGWDDPAAYGHPKGGALSRPGQAPPSHISTNVRQCQDPKMPRRCHGNSGRVKTAQRRKGSLDASAIMCVRWAHCLVLTGECCQRQQGVQTPAAGTALFSSPAGKRSGDEMGRAYRAERSRGGRHRAPRPCALASAKRKDGGHGDGRERTQPR